MAYTITSESYGARLPKITATADSTDDLATLGTNFAEGSTCVISDTTYKLDKVKGWVDPSSGGGGGASVTTVNVTEEGTLWTCDKTWQEIYDAFQTGRVLLNLPVSNEGDEAIVSLLGVTNLYGSYGIYYPYNNSVMSMTASAADGYPYASFD